MWCRWAQPQGQTGTRTGPVPRGSTRMSVRVLYCVQLWTHERVNSCGKGDGLRSLLSLHDVEISSVLSASQSHDRNGDGRDDASKYDKEAPGQWVGRTRFTIRGRPELLPDRPLATPPTPEEQWILWSQGGPGPGPRCSGTWQWTRSSGLQSRRPPSSGPWTGGEEMVRGAWSGAGESRLL